MREGSDEENSCPTALLGRSVLSLLSHSVEKRLEFCRMEISVLNFMHRSNKSYISIYPQVSLQDLLSLIQR